MTLFKGRRSSAVVNPDIAAAREELHKYQDEVTAVKAELGRLQVQLKEHEDMSEDIVQLANKERRLKSEVSSKLGTIKDLDDQISQLQKTRDDMIIENNRLSESMACEIQGMQIEFDEASARYHKVVSDKENQLSKIDEKIETVKALLADLRHQSDGQEMCLDELKLAVKKANEEYGNAQGKLNLLLDEVITVEAKRDGLEKGLRERQQHLDEVNIQITVAAKQLEEMTLKIAECTADLAKRENEVAIREKLAEEKRTQLLEAKKQLEVYFNKPMPSIII